MARKMFKSPFVSVVMPVRNEADFIRRSLQAILDQDYPHDSMEIVIADGLSTDETRALIERLKPTTEIFIKVIDNPQGIAPTGLNAAITESKGEIIIRVDGHTIIENDYVSQCVAALKRSEACNVGGRMNAVASNRVGEAVALATSSPFGIGNARFHYSEKEEYVDTVYLGAWRRRTFAEYGFFDEELVRNQDDEFNYRLRGGGEKILLSPLIKSRYYNRSSWRKLWKQYYQYGFWKIRVLQKHPRQMQFRQFVPFIFVASVFLFAFAGIFSLVGRAALAAILGLYVSAALLAALRAARQAKRFAALPLIFFGFSILHFSYGFGFAAGLIFFGGKWRRKRLKSATLSSLRS